MAGRQGQSRVVCRAGPVSDIRGVHLAVRRPVVVVVAGGGHGPAAGGGAWRTRARVRVRVVVWVVSICDEDEDVLLVAVAGGGAGVALDHSLCGEVVLYLFTEDGDVVVLLDDSC